ncbi:protein of unknown function [Pararobbsia alpina]
MGLLHAFRHFAAGNAIGQLPVQAASAYSPVDALVTVD